MSVINQMLKDLDKRSEQQIQSSATVIMPTKEHSLFKTIVITVLVMLLLTVSIFYFWNNYQNSQTLNQKPLKESVITAVNNNEAAQPPLSVASLPVKEEKTIKLEVNAPQEELEKTALQNTSIIKPSTNEAAALQALAPAITNKKETSVEPKVTKKVNNVALKDDSTVEKLKVEKLKIEKNNGSSNQESINSKESSLTISRKQLSPQALSKQKMAKAERAIAESNLAKAEQLFEEILLIMPEHDVARQQLSALLFGRKLYQPAINLLQQGIVTTPNNHTFRLMKARIHLTLKQTEQAFDALSPLDNILDIEYQSILANTAQQIGNFTAAIKSYSVLIKLEPQQGRHWLGLAIAYDSNSEFIEASKAYQQAIQQGGLSNAAFNFIQQRLAELGE